MTWTSEIIISRLKEASETLKQIPLTNRDYPFGPRGRWPEYAEEKSVDGALEPEITELVIAARQDDPFLIERAVAIAEGFIEEPDRAYKPTELVRLTASVEKIQRMNEAISWLWWLTKKQALALQSLAEGRNVGKVARKLKCARWAVWVYRTQGLRRILGKLNGEKNICRTE